jgi:hypothetical protein
MELQEQVQRPLRSLAAGLGRPTLSDGPSFAAFPPLDAEEMALDLDLYVRAAEAGQRGEPPPHAKPPDAIETAIGTAIASGAREATLAYRAQLAQHDARIRRTFLTETECLEIEASCGGLLEELDAPLRETQSRLIDFWRGHVEPLEEEFHDFRVRNALERPPRLVSRVEILLRGLILLALAALGMFVHERLLPGGEAGGSRRVPGFVWALLNVGAAVWFARHGLPALVGRGFRSKIVGVVTAGAFLIFGIVVNLLAAHHRDVWVAHQGHPTLGALWRHASHGLFALDSPVSILPAVLGIGWSALATFVAAGMGEIYPGSGAVGRRRATAQAAYRLEASGCSARLAVIQRTAEADLRATIEAVQGRERESNLTVEARSRFHREFLDYLDQLAAVHGQLCGRYRQINSAVQKGQVPRYFQHEVERPECLAALELPPPPRPRQEWNLAVEFLEHQAQRVAALFARALAPHETEEDPRAERVEVEDAP